MKGDRYINGSLDARHLHSSLARAAGFPATLYGNLCPAVPGNSQRGQMARPGCHSPLPSNHYPAYSLPASDHPAKPYSYPGCPHLHIRVGYYPNCDISSQASPHIQNARTSCHGYTYCDAVTSRDTHQAGAPYKDEAFRPGFHNYFTKP
jgi:hypothetical protein